MDVRSWITDHHATYEVSPYYLMLDDSDGGGRASRKVQAGFDIDVYGVNPEADRMDPPAAQDYAFGLAVLQRLVAEVAHDAGDSCSVELIALPGRIVLDARGYGKAKAVVRITISHLGPLDQPAGLPESQALEKVKERLDALGIARR
jgi:hypothetical protein